MIQEFSFGPWLPDQIDFRNPGLEDLNNAIPGVGGYQPARSFFGSGASVSGTIIGAGSAFLQDGSVLVFVATTADLHVIRAGTATASSLSLSLGTADVVVFEQFNSAVYATTKNGDTWVLSDVATGNTFSAAAGSPPEANAMGRVGDFLVMGDLTDIDASDAPYRLRWSRFNNPQGAWDTDLGAQSGAQDLDPKFGPITAITGGIRGLVFQARGVSRLDPNGQASVFRLDTFETNRGCIAGRSVVQVGEAAYYLTHDGFFVTDGTTPRPVSTGKVWEWFKENSASAFRTDIIGSVDYERRCVVWAFSDQSDGTYTRLLWYNWETGEWGNTTQAVQWLIEGAKSGVTLEQLAVTYPDLDAMSISLDSPEFDATGRNLQAFSGNELGSLTGDTLAAYFEGGDLHPFQGRQAFIDEVYPLVDSTSAQIALVSRDTMQEPIRESAPVSVGSIGFAPFNHDARYFRVKTYLPAGEIWRDAYGYQVNAKRSSAT